MRRLHAPIAQFSRLAISVVVSAAAISCAGPHLEPIDEPEVESPPAPGPNNAPPEPSGGTESLTEDNLPADPMALDPGPDLPAPPDLPKGAPQRISVRHILIAYEGCVGTDPNLRRSRAEAVRRAESILQQIQSGASLGALAVKESDGPSAAREGSLGAFGRGTMHPDFEKAAFALKVGEVSGLVETPFGIHIIERRPLEEVHLGHVLVQWEGVQRSAATRSKEEALAIAETARARLLAGESLAAVAGELSDGATGPRGGDLGWFQKGHVMPQFEPAFKLKRGGVGDVTETAFGYHVLVRLE